MSAGEHTYKQNVKAAGGRGTSLVAQGLRLCAFNVGSTGLIPGQENKIPHAYGVTKKKKNRGRERDMEGESEGSWAAAD